MFSKFINGTNIFKPNSGVHSQSNPTWKQLIKSHRFPSSECNCEVERVKILNLSVFQSELYDDLGISEQLYYKVYEALQMHSGETVYDKAVSEILIHSLLFAYSILL